MRKLVVILLAIGGLSVAAGRMIVNPPPLLFTDGDVDEDIPKNATASGALVWQARKFAGIEDPRVEAQFLFGSADVYVGKQDWEKIPFPDRPTVAGILARAWCSRITNRTLLTNISIRDIRTGKELRRCYCD